MRKVIVAPEKRSNDRLEIAQTITRRITSLTAIRRSSNKSPIVGWQARCYHCHSDPTFHIDDWNGAYDWTVNHTCFFRTPKKTKVTHHSNLHSGITGHSAR